MAHIGVDGEEYIAAIRDGAIDPFGFTADELEAQLDAFDAELRERLLTLSDEQVEELARTGAPIPPLHDPVDETPALARVRADEAFVGGIVALERQSARIDGARRALMAEHAQRVLELPGDAGPALKELATMAAVEVGLTQASVMSKMTEAHSVVTELGAAHEAAAAGLMTTAHLRVIEQQTRDLRLDAHVDAAERTRVVQELTDLAQRVSTSQLRAKAQRVVDDVLTEPVQRRHDTARAKRRVDLFTGSDGMGDLVVHGPVLELTACMDRLTQAARGKAKDDPRTYDQFRTDALLEVMLAGVIPDDAHGLSAIKAQVAITIPATSLLDDGARDDDSPSRAFPALLDGRTIVDPVTVRRITADTTTWLRLFTDPVTGIPITVDSYRPSAAQRHWLQLRDSGCRGPGCAKPAMRADLDHTQDFARGGTTSIGNLGHLCRADHGLKHDTRWTLEQRPGGAMRWTSPIGQVITSDVEPAGPVFADAPQSTAAPPGSTRAERRERWTARRTGIDDDARPTGMAPRAREGGPPQAADAELWGCAPTAAAGEHAPF
jgi:hypothetical protein